ncbi:hypothetical protein [Lacticaseibacillus sp. GG6-2]
MKKLTAILSIIAVAAFVALASFVTVSANGGKTGDAAAQIANDDFYSQSAYVHITSSGQQSGPDTLSFVGVSDQTTQVRVADLFNTDAPLMKVNYTLKGQQLVIDKSDLPAGVSSYTVDIQDGANHVTATEVKNGQTRTRVGYAINKYSEVLATTQIN